MLTMLFSSHTYVLCSCFSSFSVCKYKAWYRCDGGAKFCRWHNPEVSRKLYDCVHHYLAQRKILLFLVVFVGVSDTIYVRYLAVVLLYITRLLKWRCDGRLTFPYLGSLLLTEISSTSIRIMAWIRNYIHVKQRDVLLNDVLTSTAV